MENLENKNKENNDTGNLLMLHEYTEKTLYKNIHDRYINLKQIYSFIGYSILMAVNPYENLENYYYTEKKKKEYKKYFDNIKIDPPEPHIYYLVEDSYRNMLENKKNQNFIISGESGSGKTESTKIIIDYLVNNTKENINEKLLAANPLLEAFGNAKTIKNNNSSRFGKFIKIIFSKNGKILKANIQSYLLEKSRVINIQKGERNYHIFYQFILGSNEEEKLKYEIKNIEYYDNLNNKENENVNDLNKNMNDAQDFKITKENLKKFNFSEQDIDNIFKIISGILYLGNIKFENLDNDNIEISNEPDFKRAAKFLELDEEKLKEILITHKVKFGKEIIQKKYKKNECYINKNGMVQHIYSQLFEYIISKINNEMDNKNNNNNNVEKTLQISILDIFGFENFENNSFEQLCINYCNERLQQYFNKHVLYEEQKFYKEEGIKWDYVKYKENQKIIKENQKIIKLIDDYIFKCLKDQNKNNIDQNKDIAFRKSLYKEVFKSNEFESILIEEKLGKDYIKINHYAGIIKYYINGIVNKNLDQISVEIKNALSDSKNSIIKERFPKIEEEEINRNNQMLQPTLSEQFKKQIDELFKNFDNSNNKYIKCIKPNNKKEPNNFEEKVVLEQLNYGGILETIKIKNQGYQIYQLKEEFYNKYKWLIPEIKNEEFNDELIQTMVKNLVDIDLDNNPCKKTNINLKIGKNYIFMKNELNYF